MNLSPRADAALLRLAKGVVFGTLVLAIDAAVTLLTSNSLDLAPGTSTLLVAYLVPALLGAEKWANWQESQNQPTPTAPGYPQAR